MTESTHPKKWWIESPAVLPEHDISYMCKVCRHINFKYLIFESPFMQVLEEIHLSSLSDILANQTCSFCRLVKSTLDNAFGADALPLEYEGQAVKILMIVAFTEVVTLSGPKQLLLWVKPDPMKSRKTPSLYIHHIAGSDWNDDKKGEDKAMPTSHVAALTATAWNRTCQIGHGNCKNWDLPAEFGTLPTSFRLIDVKRKCIIAANNTFEYVTLSYVWGRSSTFQLNKKNQGELQEDGALLKYENLLPQTINDAMYLVEKMYDRYLWVDRLCIVQDDDDDISQVASMNVIYGSSVLTIAATFGDNADAGMPGVRPGSRDTAWWKAERIQDLTLAVKPHSFEMSVEDSKWNTRAWTFQERILSKRVLYVTKQRLFFKCEHNVAVRSEDAAYSTFKPRKLLDYPMDDIGNDLVPILWSINTITYQRIVPRYTSRQLSFVTDIVRAFEGIAAKLQPVFRGPLPFGLPQTELDHALLWLPSGALIRRTDPLTGTPLFPSWSWMGWIGTVDYDGKEKLSRIQWVDSEGIVYEADELRKPLLKDPSEQAEWLSRWTKHEMRSVFQYYVEDSNPDIWFRHPTAKEDERLSGPDLLPGTSHFRFWASTVHLNVIGEWCPPPNEKGPQWRMQLVDPDGYAWGHLTMPIDLLYQLDFKQYNYDLIAISRTTHALSNDELSQGRNSKLHNRDVVIYPEKLIDSEDITMEKQSFPDEPSMENDKWKLGIDRRRFDIHKPFCLYNLLLIEWRADVAYRIAIGVGHIDGWAQSDVVRKLVTLG